MRLSEALELHELELFLTPANRWLARSVDGPCEVVDEWASQLADWWRKSPTSIRECDACGEVSLTGASKKRKCHRGICGGTMVPLAPRFTKPRPKGRTRKKEV